MTRRWAVPLLAFALAVAGCSEGGVTRSARSAGDARRVRVTPRFELGDASLLPGHPGGLAVDRDGAVVAVDQRRVVAFDTAGGPRWSAPVVGAAGGIPWLGHGLAVVPTRSTDLSPRGAAAGGCVALDRASGEHRWAYEEPGRSGVAVSGLGDRVYCVFADATIVAVDATTGARVWRTRVVTHSAADVVQVAERTTFVVDAASQRLALVVIVNDLWALDTRDLATGADRESWSLAHFQPSSSPVSIGPGRVLVASGSRQVCVFDLVRRVVASCADGVPAPDGFDSGSVPVVTDDGLAIVVASEGTVAAIDVTHMTRRWTAHLDRPVFAVQPVVSGGAVVVADSAGGTWALRLDDGSRVALPGLGGPVIASSADPEGGVEVAVHTDSGGRIQRLRPTG